MGSTSGRKSALALAAFAAGSAFTASALGAPEGPTMPILDEYVAPPECPSPDAFSDGGGGRARQSWRPVRAPRRTATWACSRTESGERTSRGHCENVANALATVIAIAAPSRCRRRPEPPPRARTPRATSSASAASTASVSARPPGPSRHAPRAVPSTRVAHGGEPPTTGRTAWSRVQESAGVRASAARRRLRCASWRTTRGVTGASTDAGPSPGRRGDGPTPRWEGGRRGSRVYGNVTLGLAGRARARDPTGDGNRRHRGCGCGRATRENTRRK